MSEHTIRRAAPAVLFAGVLLMWAASLPAAASVAMAEPGGPDQDVYNEGRSLVFEEAWGKARTVFEGLVKRYPQSPFVDDALYWTAFALYEEGHPDQGYETLRTLTTRFPDSPWSDDARALMVRCAEAALKQKPEGGGSTRVARAGSENEYKRFLEESTRDRSAKVSLLAIDTLLTQDPRKAPDLLERVDSSSGPVEGASVVLDRFFGKEKVKVTFDDRNAGLSEGNVHVLVREADQAVRLSLEEALMIVGGAGPRRFPDPIRAEMRDRILEAERSLVTQGPVREENGRRRARSSTIVRVVDGEVHYYDNGAETVRVVVLRRAAGYAPENVQVFVDGAGGMKHVALADVEASTPGPTAETLSNDALRYLRQTLGVIRLDLDAPAR